MGPCWVVEPPGVLHLAPDGKKELIAFTKRYGLRNEYFKDMINRGRSEHKRLSLIHI